MSKQWNPVLYWMYRNITLNQGKNLFTVAVLLVLSYFFVLKPIYHAGQKESVGKITAIEGMQVNTMEDAREAIDKDYHFYYLFNPQDRNDTTLTSLVAIGSSLPEGRNKNRMKLIGVTSLQVTGVGVAIIIGQQGRINEDVLLTTSGLGVGLSYNFTDNLFGGVGAQTDWEVDSFKTIPEHTKAVIYGGCRF